MNESPVVSSEEVTTGFFRIHAVLGHEEQPRKDGSLMKTLLKLPKETASLRKRDKPAILAVRASCD